MESDGMHVIKSKTDNTYIGTSNNFEKVIIVGSEDPLRMVFAEIEYAERFIDERGLNAEDYKIIPESEHADEKEKTKTNQTTRTLDNNLIQ